MYVIYPGAIFEKFRPEAILKKRTLKCALLSNERNFPLRYSFSYPYVCVDRKLTRPIFMKLMLWRHYGDKSNSRNVLSAFKTPYNFTSQKTCYCFVFQFWNKLINFLTPYFSHWFYTKFYLYFHILWEFFAKNCVRTLRGFLKFVFFCCCCKSLIHWCLVKQFRCYSKTYIRQVKFN